VLRSAARFEAGGGVSRQYACRARTLRDQSRRPQGPARGRRGQDRAAGQRLPLALLLPDPRHARGRVHRAAARAQAREREGRWLISLACSRPVTDRSSRGIGRPCRETTATGWRPPSTRSGGGSCRPDPLVVISPAHWGNFFIRNLPPVCLGIGDEHDGPPEPFMKKVFPRERLKGHAAFGRHLLETALNGDFEPALSHRLKLDHGTCIPLWRIGVDSELPIVPVIVNDLEEPMPSIRRCLAWGRLLRQAIESYPEPLRVAVLGTGGLSHSIGEPTMGWIDEEFDHACIRHFEDGEDARLAAFLTEALARTGNGAHEIRDW